MTDVKNNRQVLTVLFLGVLMGALDIAIVGPALPALRDAFGVDDRAVAWVFTIYVFFNLVGAPLMSKLSDRYGRRTIYLLDIGLFALGSLGVAASMNFTMLLASRALQGISAGGIWPVASAVVGDTFPQEKKGSALGLIGAVFGLAFIVGPILGGVLLLLSWHWLFLINLPLAVVILVMGARILPSTHADVHQPFDFAGLVLMALILAGLTFGINQLDTATVGQSLLSISVWPFLISALAGVFAFAWVEKRAPDPLIQPDLFGSRQLVLAYLLSVGAGLGEAAMVFLPALAIASFGMSESSASFMLLPLVLAISVGSPLGGRLLNQLGSRTIILAGTVTLTLGMLLLGLFGANMTAFIAAGILIGLGLASLLGAPIRYIMLNEVPERDRTAAQGMVTISTGVGQLVSGALVGAVAASHGGGVDGYTLSYLFVAAAGVALVLMSMGLKSSAQEKIQAAQPA